MANNANNGKAPKRGASFIRSMAAGYARNWAAHEGMTEDEKTYTVNAVGNISAFVDDSWRAVDKILVNPDLTERGKATAIDKIRAKLDEDLTAFRKHAAELHKQWTDGRRLAAEGYVKSKAGWEPAQKPAEPTIASELLKAEYRSLLRGLTPEERYERYITAVQDGSDPVFVEAVEAGPGGTFALVTAEQRAKATEVKVAKSPVSKYLDGLNQRYTALSTAVNMAQHELDGTGYAPVPEEPAAAPRKEPVFGSSPEGEAMARGTHR
ncbi:MAG: hypothetical protein ABI051_03320 [Vicinamibacterales bacterium]